MSKPVKRGYRDFSAAERYEIVQEYLRGGVTKQAIWMKYSGNRIEHGQILMMLREFGYAPNEVPPRSRSASAQGVEVKKESKPKENVVSVVRNRRIEELERKLADAELEVLLYKAMIEIAEAEYGVVIKKKPGQGQSI